MSVLVIAAAAAPVATFVAGLFVGANNAKKVQAEKAAVAGAATSVASAAATVKKAV